jgi:phosphopantetheinyl transferase (holo-ACP synthase)
MIGNDIVDLHLAKTQSNWQRKGFLEKQFTIEERQTILESENPFLQVWLFWSLKEAAYKCYVQEHQKRFFAPKKFHCKMISPSKGIVTIENNKYHTKSIITALYIHSTATIKSNYKMVSDLFFMDKKASRTKTTNRNLLSFFTDETSLKKNEFGIPYLYENNQKLAVSFSTSHHGDYGGFVILK